MSAQEGLQLDRFNIIALLLWSMQIGTRGVMRTDAMSSLLESLALVSTQVIFVHHAALLRTRLS